MERVGSSSGAPKHKVVIRECGALAVGKRTSHQLEGGKEGEGEEKANGEK